MTRVRLLAIAAALALSTHAVLADVRADEKTHLQFAGMLGKVVNFFGGKATREGVTSTVAVKGDRKLTLNDMTGQIIDLNEEKVYDLDIKKKSYKVTTFAELRRRMEEAQKKAAENAAKEEGKPAPKETPSQPPEKQIEIDVDLKNTGQTKMINGFDTKQQVLTITIREKGKTLEQGGGMVTTADMWIGPKIAAMKEVAEFDMKYAQKLYGSSLAGVSAISAEQMAAAMAMYPTMKQMLGRMNVEGGKIDGTAILTTTTMDAVKSEAEMAAEQNQQKEESKPSVSGGVGGLLGGLAKKTVAKKAGGGDDANKARANIMTSTNEILKVSTDVSAADVGIPAGYKESK